MLGGTLFFHGKGVSPVHGSPIPSKKSDYCEGEDTCRERLRPLVVM